MCSVSRRHMRRWFRDIAWSTASVSAETRDRARELGIELVELDTWYDVDDVRSLNRLLAETSGYAAPRTKAAAERLGLRHLLQSDAERGDAE